MLIAYVRHVVIKTTCNGYDRTHCGGNTTLGTNMDEEAWYQCRLCLLMLLCRKDVVMIHVQFL